MGILQDTNYQNPEQGFSSCRRDEDLYKIQLAAYAQAFLNFVLPLFVAPSPAKMPSWTKFEIITMGGAKEGTRTAMEVDSIAAKVVTEST